MMFRGGSPRVGNTHTDNIILGGIFFSKKKIESTRLGSKMATYTLEQVSENTVLGDQDG